MEFSGKMLPMIQIPPLGSGAVAGHRASVPFSILLLSVATLNAGCSIKPSPLPPTAPAFAESARLEGIRKIKNGDTIERVLSLAGEPDARKINSIATLFGPRDSFHVFRYFLPNQTPSRLEPSKYVSVNLGRKSLKVISVFSNVKEVRSIPFDDGWQRESVAGG